MGLDRSASELLVLAREPRLLGREALPFVFTRAGRPPLVERPGDLGGVLVLPGLEEVAAYALDLEDPVQIIGVGMGREQQQVRRRAGLPEPWRLPIP